jgi:hypothetical protein
MPDKRGSTIESLKGYLTIKSRQRTNTKLYDGLVDLSPSALPSVSPKVMTKKMTTFSIATLGEKRWRSKKWLFYGFGQFCAKRDQGDQERERIPFTSI